MPDAVLQLMRRASNLVNRFVAQRYGETFPFFYVSEYPKSGGTWLCNMMADVLQAQRPDRSIFPIGCASVLHNHWEYMPRLRRVTYLYRDGRDVVVSALFHRLRDMDSDNTVIRRRTRRALDRIFGAGFESKDAGSLLPRFIEDLYKHPWGARMTWADHINQWRPEGGRPHVCYVSYEQLREDPVAHLRRVCEAAADREIPAWRIEMTIEKFSMANQTGRKPGEESRGHFIRKGIVGDWKNHFTAEAAREFDRVAGEELVRLGYEADRRWVESVGGAGEPARTAL